MWKLPAQTYGYDSKVQDVLYPGDETKIYIYMKNNLM